MKNLLYTLLAALLLVACIPSTSFSINKYATGIWPTEEGWQATFEMDDDGESSQSMLTSIENTDDGQIFKFTHITWGQNIKQFQLTYLKDAKGDIYFIDFLNLTTGQNYYYDPPILYLDLPLSPGKTWESKSTFFTSPDPDDPGEAEHHRFSVEKAEVETPMGTYQTLKLLDDPVAGYPMGGDYFMSGFGLVAFESNVDGRMSRMVGNHEEGWDPKIGYGEDVSINFGWKPHMKWSANRVSTKNEFTSSTEDLDSMEQDFSLSVERMPTGLVINIEDRVYPLVMEDEILNEAEANLLAAFSRTKSSFMVGADGQFQSSIASESHLDEAREYISSLLSSNSSSSSASKEELKQAYIHLMSAASFDSAYRSLWEDLIETWRDSQITIGVLYERTSTYTLYDYPDRPVDMVTVHMLTGRCPCEEGDESFDCVEIILSGYSLSGEGIALTIDNGVKVILEPEGMFPYYLESFSTFRMAGDPEHDDAAKSIQSVYHFKPKAVKTNARNHRGY